MPQEARNSIVLPKNSPVATLILQHIHQEIEHFGCMQSMLAMLPQKYWIPQANSAIKKLIARCRVCQRFNTKTGKQKMADLPKDLLLPDQPPFTNMGFDLSGPFEVKRGRSFVKRYGVIFTCLTMRAVHIDIAHNLDADSCINAIH